jgi:hypothetical protein
MSFEFLGASGELSQLLAVVDDSRLGGARREFRASPVPSSNWVIANCNGCRNSATSRVATNSHAITVNDQLPILIARSLRSGAVRQALLLRSAAAHRVKNSAGVMLTTPK